MRKPEVPIVVDVEASGFDSRSYPIEVGVAFESTDRYCKIIRPVESWTHWDEEAERLHGISRAVLQSDGSAVRTVAAELNEMLAGKTVYSDAWVVDQPWLITLYEHASLSMNFRISPLEAILSEWQIAHWTEIKSKLEEETKVIRHRASNDAWLIQRTYVLSSMREKSFHNPLAKVAVKN